MNKKAQDLSISTIIIAAVAVVVLVVLVAIFTGRLGLFTSVLGTTSAEKTKDSALNLCIPADELYDAINTAQITYNKNTNEQNKNALTAAQKAKDDNLAECKLKETQVECNAGNCQWVGS